MIADTSVSASHRALAVPNVSWSTQMFIRVRAGTV
jgi:hypothetical protein